MQTTRMWVQLLWWGVFKYHVTDYFKVETPALSKSVRIPGLYKVYEFKNFKIKYIKILYWLNKIIRFFITAE